MTTTKGQSDIGLTDKLYWRQSRHASMKFHCFEPANAGRSGGRRFYRALCCDEITLVNSGGQACRRPPPYARCAACDNAEMKRRGWVESGPTSPNWDEFL